MLRQGPSILAKPEVSRESIAMTLQAADPPTPSYAKPAATAVVFRRAPDGGDPQLLMLQRAAAMRFAGGAAVFPGGQVDPGDRDLATAIAADLPPDDAAARIAAVRETLEEAGLLLGVTAAVSVDAAREAREMVMGQVALGDVLDRFGWTLDLRRFVPFARWCPTHLPSFDTRFYLYDLGTGAVDVAADQIENQRLFWATARQTLDEAATGRISVIFPTMRNLERLAGFRSFDEARAHALDVPPRLIEPRVETIDGVDCLTIPNDAGYPVTSQRLDEAIRGMIAP